MLLKVYLELLEVIYQEHQVVKEALFEVNLELFFSDRVLSVDQVLKRLQKNGSHRLWVIRQINLANQ